MQEFTVDTIEGFIATVRQIRHDWDQTKPEDYTEIWYRGVNNAEHLLLPGAYWRNPCDEISLVLSFRALAPMLVGKEPADEWDWYFLMQHYRLPTRLLDWTESPLHGLHFALHEQAHDAIPCVWVLDPTALNYTAHGPDHDHVYVPIRTDLSLGYSYWLPQYCGRHLAAQMFPTDAAHKFKSNEWPLAIYAKRTNPRIFAQKGVFTVHGTEEVPLEAFQIMNAAGEERLARILIDPASRDRLIDDLFLLGFTQTATYPEPESIAADLKRMYKVRP